MFKNLSVLHLESGIIYDFDEQVCVNIQLVNGKCHIEIILDPVDDSKIVYGYLGQDFCECNSKQTQTGAG